MALAVPYRKDFDGWEKLLVAGATLFGTGFGLAKVWPHLFKRLENQDNLHERQSAQAFATLQGEVAALRAELAAQRAEHRNEILALRAEHSQELEALEKRVDANSRAAQAAQSETATLRTDLRLKEVECEQLRTENTRLLGERTEYAARVVELESRVGAMTTMAQEVARMREMLQHRTGRVDGDA